MSQTTRLRVDICTKIKTPDGMLRSSGKEQGFQDVRMRQQRVEKFIVTNAEHDLHLLYGCCGDVKHSWNDSRRYTAATIRPKMLTSSPGDQHRTGEPEPLPTLQADIRSRLAQPHTHR
ncbi:myozenin-1b isoform X2, partial [Lates japonicus]